jgi:hypothetical protein
MNANTKVKLSDLEYAQSRANATRRVYIVSNMGHVVLDCKDNRSMFTNIGCGVAFRVSPAK